MTDTTNRSTVCDAPFRVRRARLPPRGVPRAIARGDHWRRQPAVSDRHRAVRARRPGSARNRAVVRADLARSGLFRLIEAGTQPIPENAAVAFADWKSRGADALAIGSASPAGRWPLRRALSACYDTVKQGQLDGLSYRQPGVGSAFDGAPHRRPHLRKDSPANAASSRPASRTSCRPRATSWELHIADADGADSAGRAALARADHFAGVVAGWHPAGLRFV